METNPIAAGFTLSGLWAADISTGVALLISSATLLERDIYEWALERKGLNVSEARSYRLSKVLSLLIGIIGFIMALKASSILKVLLIGLSLCAPFTVIFLFTAYLPEFCKKNAAFWTLLAGGIIIFLWFLFPWIRFVPHAIFLEWIISLPAFILLCIVFKEPVSHGKYRYHLRGR